jgi:hypothetical protein
MPLADWSSKGWIRSHRTSPEEIQELLAIADRDLVRQFDTFRKKRNISGYERVGAVSDQEAKDMAALARRLKEAVERWLCAHHPELG